MGTTDTPICFPQSLQDRLAFNFPEVETPGCLGRSSFRWWRAQFLEWHLERFSSGEDHRPLDEVLQFPDIPRPCPFGHSLHRPRGNLSDIFLHAARVSAHEVFDEERYVVPSFAQRGQMDWENRACN